MSHYAILPKLPVPPLSGSLDRFLSSLRPLLSPRDFSEAVRVTGTFSEGQGPHLQARLERLAEETDNWASYVSVHQRYLINRSSLILTNGVGILLQSFGGSDSYLYFLSVYIRSNVHAFKQARYDLLTQDTYEGVPLCMAQYKNRFGVSRLPGLTTDSYCRSPDSRHIIVMHAGSMYKVPVYLGGGECLVSVQEMYGLLSQVLTDTQREGHRSVGLLTALERDQWYSAREQLMESPMNRETLRAVETCLFGVCLDDYEAEKLTSDDKLKRGLFGDLKDPFFNRWFGMSYQCMISADGYLTSYTEHSLVDGNLASQMAALKSASIGPDYKLDTSLKLELLKWDISPWLEGEIERARVMVNTLCNQYNIHTFNFTDYGKDFVKNYGLYFQGYIQLALQLSYYKMYHRLAATYQPVSLRKFHGGRLEHPHIVSEESKAFVESMDRDCDNRERYKLMKQAIDKHRLILADANQGQAYCKHMLGLKMIADREGLKIELFQKDFFKVFTQHNLATSMVYMNVPMTSMHPMHSKVGHFVVFQVADSSINFSVTTLLLSHQSVTSEEFGAKIRDSLYEMQQLVVTQATNGMLESKL